MTDEREAAKPDTRSMALAVDVLVRASTVATLATADRASGHPYPSLVETATGLDGAPLLLLSALARHTRNLEADPRAAILYDRRAERDNPLATERVTLTGRLERCGDPAAAARYLRLHPVAAGYISFGDFSVWRMDVASAHFIGGFGCIRELTSAELLTASRPTGLDGDIAAMAPALVELLRKSPAVQRDNLVPIGIDSGGVDVARENGEHATYLAYASAPDSVSEALEFAREAIARAASTGDSG